MSTYIETVRGKKESSIYSDNKRINTTMEIRRFAGGSDRMLQLTTFNRDGYIQITKEQATQLATYLLNAFNDNIYPSE